MSITESYVLDVIAAASPRLAKGNDSLEKRYDPLAHGSQPLAKG